MSSDYEKLRNQAKLNTSVSNLIAPCGMDCSLCSSYLAYINGTPKKRGKISHCPGCRPRNKQCAFLKKKCTQLNSGKINFCFECKKYPCLNLTHLDNMYINKYGMSFLNNLDKIRDDGIEEFVKHQQKKYGCKKCNGKISIHSKKCFHCDTINSWKD